MSLTSTLAHASAIATVRIVRCQPDSGGCGPEECAHAPSLAFPMRGLFVKHHGRSSRVVADVCHAVFFNANEPYRVSHPVNGGDECLVIEPSSETLRDVLSAQDSAAAQSNDAIFRRTHVSLPPAALALRKWLCYRLDRGSATSLEADETALQLFDAAVRRVTLDAPPFARRSRAQDVVEATTITLAGRPEERWSLGALAQRVYTSPFHLARMFRRCVGVPLHRYHSLSRLAAALDHVLDSSRDLSTIGADLGFASHSHFTAAFRSAFGCTPSTLRRNADTRDAVEMRKILTARLRRSS